jgi:hypothetical protein
MSEINQIPNINGQIISVRQLNIPKINVWDADIPNVVSPYVPVTVYIGKPIVDIPGCVEVHPENKYPGGTKNKKLAEDDKTVTYCDANTPSYTPMNYQPEQLTIYREVPPPKVEPPPEPDLTTPETPSIPTPEGDPECPGPTSLRIGSVGPSQKEKVVGHELQKTPQGTLICVELYEDINIAEQYLPSAQVAATTAVIATVAGASALLAKPLADLLLKVFKPLIKKILTKVTGKKELKPTRQEILTNEYREKKGLPPIKKKK